MQVLENIIPFKFWEMTIKICTLFFLKADKDNSQMLGKINQRLGVFHKAQFHLWFVKIM